MVDINDDPTETEFVGQMATLSSWGLESETISRQILKVAYPTILKKESCLIHDQTSQICVESVCGVSYFKYSSIFPIHITKCHIQGNGGSPLHLLDNNDMMLIGFKSFGSSLGCEAGFPEVYTDVGFYYDWIQSYF